METGQAWHTAGWEACDTIAGAAACSDYDSVAVLLLVVPFDRSALASLPFSLFRGLR